MDKLTSILVIAHRSAADRVLLEKAMLLAHATGAHISLFSCDADLAKTLQPAGSCEDAEKAHRARQQEHLDYLRALRANAPATNVQISVDAECYSPLCEGILAKISEIEPDLIMKLPSGEHPLRRFAFGPSDWQLLQACPASLMLVRPHPWHCPPEFAAFLEISEQGTPDWARSIAQAGQYLASSCHGHLAAVYCESSADELLRALRAASLQQLAREQQIPPERVHVLMGDAAPVLTEFARRQRYDVIVLGGLTHRTGLAPLFGTLTGKLVESLDTDFVLIKRPPPARQSALPDSEHPSAAGVLWQAAFGD